MNNTETTLLSIAWNFFYKFNDKLILITLSNFKSRKQFIKSFTPLPPSVRKQKSLCCCSKQKNIIYMKRKINGFNCKREVTFYIS